MSGNDYRYVFGPVPSRRLGRSLGIDLAPLKTCSYDCVYCQLGRTTFKTVECRQYVPIDDIINELGRKLDEGHAPDYLTLSGSGEPTLFSRLDELVLRIKGMTHIPLAILTNGSLFFREDIRRSIAGVDLVIPSLDVGSADLFEIVNRPHPEITFERMVDGLIQFRRNFSKAIWLEVLLLDGITAFDSEVAKIVKIANMINPDRVQVSTAVRPPSNEFAHPVSREELTRYAAAFGDRGQVVGDFSASGLPCPHVTVTAEILALLKRRPCTLQDISGGLGIHPNEAIKQLRCLMDDDSIVGELRGQLFFYRLKSGNCETPIPTGTGRKEVNRT